MSLTEEQNAKMRGIGARAKALLLTPSAEWAVIDGEPATVRGLYTGYVMILAAIPAICSVIGGLLSLSFGSIWTGIGLSPINILVSGIVYYAFSLGSVYVMGLVIEYTAPYFGGTRDRMQAMKVAAYFPTAMWLAGVFAIFPPLWALQVLGLYCLYTLWQGLPRLMRVEQDKAPVYTLVVILASLVIILIVRAFAGALSTSVF